MMMPPPAANGERRLIRLYRGLNPAAQGTLLRFAEFLATEGVEAEAARSTRVAPVVIERPDDPEVTVPLFVLPAHRVAALAGCKTILCVQAARGIKGDLGAVKRSEALGSVE